MSNEHIGSCRRCGYDLRGAAICAQCGEDPRGWLERLIRPAPPDHSLRTQEREIERIKEKICQHREQLGKEQQRLRTHRVASDAGARFVQQTLSRLDEGILNLGKVVAEVDAQRLGIQALRARMCLEDLWRSGEHSAPPQRVVRVPGDATVIDARTGAAVAWVADAVQCWMPEDVLSPRWSARPMGGTPRRVGELLVIAPGTVLDPETGKVRWRVEGEVVAANADRVLVIAGRRAEVRNLEGALLLTLETQVDLLGGLWLEDRLLLRSVEGIELWRLTPQPSRLAGRRLAPETRLYTGGGMLLAFPLVLDGRSLVPVTVLEWPEGSVPGPFWALSSDKVVAAGECLHLWRLRQGGGPLSLPLPEAATGLQLQEGGLSVQLAQGRQLYSLDIWPPVKISRHQELQMQLRVRLPGPPARFCWQLEGSALNHRDRVRTEPFVLAIEIARWAVQVSETAPETLIPPLKMLAQDALLLSADTAVREGLSLGRQLVSQPDQNIPRLDRLLASLDLAFLLLDFLPERLKLDNDGCTRINHLYGQVVEAVTGGMAEGLAACKILPDLAPIQAQITRLNTELKQLELPWGGLAEARACLNRLEGEVSQLGDLAAAARALGPLAAAEGAMGASEALGRISRSMQELAAAVRAEAEVEALWRPSSDADLKTRLGQGLERLQQQLRQVDVT